MSIPVGGEGLGREPLLGFIWALSLPRPDPKQSPPSRDPAPAKGKASPLRFLGASWPVSSWEAGGFRPCCRHVDGATVTVCMCVHASMHALCVCVCSEHVCGYVCSECVRMSMHVPSIAHMCALHTGKHVCMCVHV